MTLKRGSLAAHVHSAVSMFDVTDENQRWLQLPKRSRREGGHVKEVLEKGCEELEECDKSKSKSPQQGL